jgi:large subunit ribosomal protein L23
MYKSIALVPRLSEKTYGLSQTNRVYTFDVPGNVNKHSVARAVAEQFEVTVTNVNIANIQGKAKRTITKRRQVKGREADYKKAYVTLAEGQSLPLFAADEEAEAKQGAIQEKVDKAAAKQAEKEAKEAAKAAKKAPKKESK